MKKLLIGGLVALFSLVAFAQETQSKHITQSGPMAWVGAGLVQSMIGTKINPG